MEELDYILNNSLNKYFSALKKVGYIANTTILRILTIIIINELLSDFKDYITDSDYNTLVDKVYCIANAECMIDTPNFRSYEDSIYNLGNSKKDNLDQSIINILENSNLLIT